MQFVKHFKHIKFLGKLHFITLNYPLDYILHPKLSNCTFCTINYHSYHALHSSVIFTVIFNRILLHVTSTCFLLRWNKIKRLKHPSSKLIKTKPKFFHISLYLTWGHPLHLHCFLKKKKRCSFRVSLVSSLAIDKVQLFYYRLAKSILRNTKSQIHGCNSCWKA